MQQHLHKSYFLFIVILVISSALPSSVSAQSSTDLVPNPAAEQWVLEQIALGQIANLETQFPNEEDRVLSATFLEKTLEDQTVNMTRYGVYIQNAIFVEPLELELIEVNYQLRLENCRFESYVDLSDGYFSHDVSFIGSTFMSWLDLNKVQIDKTFYISDANFENSSIFAYANIKGNFVGHDVRFNNTDLEADFNSLKVEASMFLRGVTFAGPVDFGFVQVGENFEADDARFNNIEQEANFNTVKVGNSLHLDRTIFAGPADFGFAEIGNNFNADDAQFTNEEQEVNFNSTIVGNSIRLNNAIFAGPADFGFVELGTNFDADDAQFTNEEQEVNFNSMKAGNSVRLNRAIFAGPADFGRSQIGISLVADDVQFTNEEQEVNFNSMRADSDVFLRRAIFAGSVDFSYGEFRVFDASEAEFQNTDYQPRFGNVIAKGEVWFDGTIFKGGANFDYATLSDLLLYGSDKDNTLPSLSLVQTVIKRKLLLWSLQIQNISAASLAVEGPTFIQHTSIRDSANFENSKFSGITIENVNWPARSESMILGGLQFQNIKVVSENDGDDWKELVEIVDRSKYNAQAYKVLENYFAAQGYSERADSIYVAYKRRERAEAFSWNSIEWWWNLFLDFFVLYGRSPGRALGWGVLVILIGCFVFRKSENMVSLLQRDIVAPKVGNRGILSRKVPMRIISSQLNTTYNPFWYSLDLFIPFVDLGYDDKWSPKSDRKWMIAYSKVHMLAGWILIPIGLLAITGVIR